MLQGISAWISGYSYMDMLGVAFREILINYTLFSQDLWSKGIPDVQTLFEGFCNYERNVDIFWSILQKKKYKIIGGVNFNEFTFIFFRKFVTIFGNIFGKMLLNYSKKFLGRVFMNFFRVSILMIVETSPIIYCEKNHKRKYDKILPDFDMKSLCKAIVFQFLNTYLEKAHLKDFQMKKPI